MPEQSGIAFFVRLAPMNRAKICVLSGDWAKAFSLR